MWYDSPHTESLEVADGDEIFLTDGKYPSKNI